MPIVVQHTPISTWTHAAREAGKWGNLGAQGAQQRDFVNRSFLQGTGIGAQATQSELGRIFTEDQAALDRTSREGIASDAIEGRVEAATASAKASAERATTSQASAMERANLYEGGRVKRAGDSAAARLTEIQRKAGIEATADFKKKELLQKMPGWFEAILSTRDIDPDIQKAMIGAVNEGMDPSAALGVGGIGAGAGGGGPPKTRQSSGGLVVKGPELQKRTLFALTDLPDRLLAYQALKNGVQPKEEFDEKGKPAGYSVAGQFALGGKPFSAKDVFAMQTQIGEMAEYIEEFAQLPFGQAYSYEDLRGYNHQLIANGLEPSFIAPLLRKQQEAEQGAFSALEKVKTLDTGKVVDMPMAERIAFFSPHHEKAAKELKLSVDEYLQAARAGKDFPAAELIPWAHSRYLQHMMDAVIQESLPDWMNPDQYQTPRTRAPTPRGQQ